VLSQVSKSRPGAPRICCLYYLEKNQRHRALLERLQCGFFLRKKPLRGRASGIHLLWFRCNHEDTVLVQNQVVKDLVLFEDLVEGATFGEVPGLCGLPTAAALDHSEGVHLGKSGGVFCSYFLVARAIEVFCGEFLSFRRPEIFQIGLRDLFVAMLLRYLVDDSHGRFGKNCLRRDHDLKLAGVLLSARAEPRSPRR